jgi:hypothetical protein
MTTELRSDLEWKNHDLFLPFFWRSRFCDQDQLLNDLPTGISCGTRSNPAIGSPARNLSSARARIVR